MHGLKGLEISVFFVLCGRQPDKCIVRHTYECATYAYPISLDILRVGVKGECLSTQLRSVLTFYQTALSVSSSEFLHTLYNTLHVASLSFTIIYTFFKTLVKLIYLHDLTFMDSDR